MSGEGRASRPPSAARGRLRAPRARDRGHRGPVRAGRPGRDVVQLPTTCCGGRPASRSGSLRSRSAAGPLLERILARDPGYRGLLTYTLPETLWLAGHGFDDLVVGYPTADRTAIAELARLTDERPRHGARADGRLGRAPRPDRGVPPGAGDAPIRVAIELDVGYWPLGGRLKIGPKRSPIRTPRQAADAGARDPRAAAAAAGGPDGLRGPHRRPRRPPARQAAPGPRDRVAAVALGARDPRPPGARSSRRCRSWPSSSS